MLGKTIAMVLVVAGSLSAGIVSVGSGSAAVNSSLTITVGYAASGTEATAIQFDLEYNAAVLAVSPTAGSAASNAGKSLSSSQLSTNVLRVMLVGLNQNVIQDGPLVLLSIGVRSGAAAGTYDLKISNISAAIKTGPSVIGSNGTVTVQASPQASTRTLTVNSSTPASSVSITVSPADNNNRSTGSTPFTLAYNSGTQVTLTAPAAAGGNNFQKWLRDGSDAGSTTTLSLTMDTDHTVTAAYVAAGSMSAGLISVGSGSGAPNSSLTITVGYAANGTEATAIQFDLEYNAAVLAVSPTAGSAASNAGKSLSSSQLSTNVLRVMLVGLNPNVIQDGPLVLLNIGIRSGAAAGTYDLKISNISAAIKTGPSVIGSNGAVTVQASTTAGPAINSGGIVNGASFASTTMSPGLIASLFGTNLAGGTEAATRVPLPTTLANTQVLVNDAPAPLFYVSPTQINFQVPLFPSPVPSTIAVGVLSGGVRSASATTRVATESPGIFLSSGLPAILDASYSLVTRANPAKAGDVLQIFCTGLGATQPAVLAGQVAPSAEPLARVVASVGVQIGGKQAVVYFAGLAPGFVGLYQVNVQVPAGVAPGDTVPLVMSVGGVNSNTVNLAVASTGSSGTAQTNPIDGLNYVWIPPGSRRAQ